MGKGGRGGHMLLDILHGGGERTKAGKGLQCKFGAAIRVGVMVEAIMAMAGAKLCSLPSG